MAAQLLKFYEEIKQQHGLVGRTKLAMLTQISSVQAENAADSDENIRKFELAVAQIRSQLNT